MYRIGKNNKKNKKTSIPQNYTKKIRKTTLSHLVIVLKAKK
jgi:hypothetical protein